jgi:hypothetical protein
MEAKCFSETSLDFQQTTRFYMPEDRAIPKGHSENLKSYIIWIDPVLLFSWAINLRD